MSRRYKETRRMRYAHARAVALFNLVQESWHDDDVMPCDEECPCCGFETAIKDCTALGCEDGTVDLYEEDPLLFGPDECASCPECSGSGVHQWCQRCGWDLVEGRFLNGKPSIPLPPRMQRVWNFLRGRQRSRGKGMEAGES